ncbi:heparin lyase I family protein [Paraburkholderia acidisoli]|uniref:Polysaccharide lyase-like protein n=1 Tax=Paraburkholderia acidisoli TaxID=2571748 RepID=A0A7Z2GI90_9BURK|nr:heparin lyase I family protein [Paraburkholderia acidisoli]QGZ62307.1 hypothetical protein FAZ98_11520 [Paraburkholderia acidisoli]
MKNNEKKLYFVGACFFIFLILIKPAHAEATKEDNKILYSDSWSDGVNHLLDVQAPVNAISVVYSSAFNGNALRVSIHHSDDFSSVANGTPRGEISFARIFRFTPGFLYTVEWSTSIPSDYKFDSMQPELFAQILQGAHGGLGPPPFSVRFVDARYQVEIRGGARAVPHVFVFGDPGADKNNVVHWRLNYRPDHAGTSAVTDLFMNGKLVVHCKECENAYANDDDAYLKIGIYKWWWQSRPSDVDERTLYFGKISVRRDEL